MVWKRGESGNPQGRPKSKEFTDCLRLHLLKNADEKFELASRHRRLDVVVMALVRDGMKGKFEAIKEIADRIEGKCTQPIGGDPNNPIITQHNYSTDDIETLKAYFEATKLPKPSETLTIEHKADEAEDDE